MTANKHYWDINVLDATKQRYRESFSNYDEVLILISGGKDSIVVLELADEIRVELGIKKKLNVLYYDQELASKTQLEHLMRIRDSQRFNFYWVCYPIHSMCLILGEVRPYIQWDITRPFVRQAPEFALKYFSRDPVNQEEVSNIIINEFMPNKRVGKVLGIRTAEAPARLQGILKSANPSRPYLVHETPIIDSLKPIYDWSEKDIFKFYYDYNIEYCGVYDQQLYGGASYRVATPLTTEGAKQLDKVRKYDPEYYNQILKVFPDIAVQALYYDKIDKSKVFDKYGITPAGILNWIGDHLEGKIKNQALKVFKSAMSYRYRQLVLEEKEYCIQPLLRIFETMLRGGYKKPVVPVAEDKLTPLMKKHEDNYTEFKKNNDYEYD